MYNAPEMTGTVAYYRLGWCAAESAASAAGLHGPEFARFSRSEARELEALTVEKKRRDRAAGRLAAKIALADHFEAEHGWRPRPEELVVGNDESGRPVLSPAGLPGPVPSFSIAHCSAGGLCAVGAPGRRVGADFEELVPRPPAVLAFVAAPDELHRLPENPRAQNELWTGKEAVLKLLGLGLDADARMVVVRGGGEEVSLSGEPERAWRASGARPLRVDFLARGAALAAVAYES